MSAIDSDWMWLSYYFSGLVLVIDGDDECLLVMWCFQYASVWLLPEIIYLVLSLFFDFVFLLVLWLLISYLDLLLPTGLLGCSFLLSVKKKKSKGKQGYLSCIL